MYGILCNDQSVILLLRMHEKIKIYKYYNQSKLNKAVSAIACADKGDVLLLMLCFSIITIDLKAPLAFYSKNILFKNFK